MKALGVTFALSPDKSEALFGFQKWDILNAEKK